MTPAEHAPGFEFTSDDAFIVTGFSAHAAMVSHDDDTTPATPTVLLELEGFSQSDLPLPEGQQSAPLRSIRVLIEKAGAEGIAGGVLNCLDMLDSIRRNQERQ